MILPTFLFLLLLILSSCNSQLPPLNQTVWIGTAPIDPSSFNGSIYLRHCSYVVSSCSYDPGNLDFEYTTVPALNGAASAVSFQSMNFPTKYLTTSTDQTPSGRLGIVGPPDPLDQDTASWTVTTGPQSNTVILGTMSKDPAFFGQVITLLSSNSPPCDWPLPDGDLVLAPLLSPSSPTQLMHFEFKPPPPGPTPPQLAFASSIVMV